MNLARILCAKMNFLRQDFRSYGITNRQTHIQTYTTEIIYHTASRVVKNTLYPLKTSPTCIQTAMRQSRERQLARWSICSMRSQTDSQCELTTVDSTLASVTSISARFVRHVVVPAQTGSRSTIKTSQRAAAAAYCCTACLASLPRLSIIMQFD